VGARHDRCGHGIFGVANLEWPSFITTLSFMGAGIVTTQIVYRVIYQRLQKPFALPPLRVATGEG
jgi:hypothetical protein